MRRAPGHDDDRVEPDAVAHRDHRLAADIVVRRGGRLERRGDVGSAGRCLREGERRVQQQRGGDEETAGERRVTDHRCPPELSRGAVPGRASGGILPRGWPRSPTWALAQVRDLCHLMAACAADPSRLVNTPRTRRPENRYSQRSPGSAEAITGCPVAAAWRLACRLGELSQQSVAPHVWHVRRWTQRDPVFTHSSHSRRTARFTVATASMCGQAASAAMLSPRSARRARPDRHDRGHRPAQKRHSKNEAFIVAERARAVTRWLEYRVRRPAGREATVSPRRHETASAWRARRPVTLRSGRDGWTTKLAKTTKVAGPVFAPSWFRAVDTPAA